MQPTSGPGLGLGLGPQGGIALGLGQHSSLAGGGVGHINPARSSSSTGV